MLLEFCTLFTIYDAFCQFNNSYHLCLYIRIITRHMLLLSNAKTFLEKYI